MDEFYISPKDREVLRELAKKQLELSQAEKNKKRIGEWYEHNSLQGKRPMIHLELGTFAQEIIPERLRCEGDFARQIETELYSNFLNQELFDDDRVTPDYFPISYDTWFTLFDIQIQVRRLNGSVGHEFEPVIEDLEEDYGKLKKSTYGVNLERTEKRRAALEEAFGDILPVRLNMGCLYSVPTQMVVHFMKMEQMMYNIYDYPELFKEMMDRIADDTLEYYRFLEDNKLILPTVAGESLGQGSCAITMNCLAGRNMGNVPLPRKMYGDLWIPRRRLDCRLPCMKNLFSPVIRKLQDSTGCFLTAAVSRWIRFGSPVSASWII